MRNIGRVVFFLGVALSWCVPVPVDVKRAAFRQLFSSAVAQGVTIQSSLATAIAPSLAASLAGKQVIEAQAQGVVTKYMLPPGLSSQSPDVAAMWGQLQDLYDQALVPTTSVPPGGGCAAEVAGAPGTANATSTAIYNWMLGQLKVVRSFATDHTLSRFK
jgi:hypothetical protein